jgi:hypothetical protein
MQGDDAEQHRHVGLQTLQVEQCTADVGIE